MAASYALREGDAAYKACLTQRHDVWPFHQIVIVSSVTTYAIELGVIFVKTTATNTTFFLSHSETRLPVRIKSGFKS